MKLVINFYANVSETSVNDLIRFVTSELAQQSERRVVEELVLQISSSGGSSDHGLLAYNYLKQLSLKITTIGMGNVDSAAVMLFCAGNQRLAMPSCRFVLHEALATINGQFGSLKLAEMARLIERITDDYVDVVSKVTGQKKQKVSRLVKDGGVLSSAEAKTKGLVTEVIDKPYLKEMKDLSILLINNAGTPVPTQPHKSAEI